MNGDRPSINVGHLNGGQFDGYINGSPFNGELNRDRPFNVRSDHGSVWSVKFTVQCVPPLQAQPTVERTLNRGFNGLLLLVNGHRTTEWAYY